MAKDAKGHGSAGRGGSTNTQKSMPRVKSDENLDKRGMLLDAAHRRSEKMAEPGKSKRKGAVEAVRTRYNREVDYANYRRLMKPRDT